MSHSKAVSLAAAAAALAFAAPAIAAEPSAKPVELTISSKAFATPESRLCMPKESVGKGRDKALPKTMCHTRAEWEAMGVTFKTR
jgi:hypothetical protein